MIPGEQQIWMFVLLSPCTIKGDSHGIPSTHSLTHVVIMAALPASTPFDCALTLKFHIIQQKKEKAFEHRQAEMQANKKKKIMQIRSEVVYSTHFHCKSEIRGKLQTRMILPKMYWLPKRSTAHTVSLSQKPRRRD